MEIKNSIAVISGGGSGMGAATARLLSQHGARVVLLDQNAEAIEKIAHEIKGVAITCDISQAESVERALQKITSSYGTIRIAISCAGIIQSKRMLGRQGPLPLADFEQVIKINLTGTFNLMRLAAAAMSQAPPLADGERGVIINTASIAGYEGQIGQTAYSASKGGIIALTLPAARELATWGIRVMTIAPGLVDTPLFDKVPLAARTALAESVPFPKRLAHPQEYAKLVLHIIENPMLNGEVIRLDGALRMAPE